MEFCMNHPSSVNRHIGGQNGIQGADEFLVRV
jgi:hypothetical protein